MDGWAEKGLTFEVNGRRYSRQELLAYWIKERESIRLRKEAGKPKPWSDDPVFQTVYFTNVHREDDKVTKWIRENYTMEYFSDQMVTAIVAARLFNLPPTLGEIKFPLKTSNLAWVREILLVRQKTGKKIWGGAYLITTHGMKMSKLDYCLDIISEVSKTEFVMGMKPKCSFMYEQLLRFSGLGSFLAAQIVADLKYTKGHPLYDSDDRLTFSAPGPGSLRGLAWFHGHKIHPSEYHDAIDVVKEYLDWEGDMQDLQNCLCEFDKYCRVSTGTGRSKRKYDGK